MSSAADRKLLFDRGVLTIAAGKPLYMRLAVNLARSFLLHNAHTDIRFQLATDQPDLLPADLRGRVELLPFDAEKYGIGFSSKLHQDAMTRARRTLFIDADCLVYGPLEKAFDAFEGHPVSVIGTPRGSGEFWGDLAARCERFNVPAISDFMGAVYYHEYGETSRAVFAKARELEPQYDEIGCIRLRGRPNEEPLLGIAMALHDQPPVPEDGTLKADALNYRTRVDVDVLSGRARLCNEPGRPGYQEHWPLRESQPLIVHYNNEFVRTPAYRGEAAKLRLCARGVPAGVSRMGGGAFVRAPLEGVQKGKDALRPQYRSVFGTRRRRANERVS